MGGKIGSTLRELQGQNVRRILRRRKSKGLKLACDACAECTLGGVQDAINPAGRGYKEDCVKRYWDFAVCRTRAERTIESLAKDVQGCGPVVEGGLKVALRMPSLRYRGFDLRLLRRAADKRQ